MKLHIHHRAGWLFALLFIAMHASAAMPTLNFEHLNSQLLSIITNRTMTDATLLQAISRLGRVNEPASFWTGIADDPSYSIQQRRRAIFALFRRHCHVGETCSELREIIAPAKWLDESGITRIPFVFGRMPVEVLPGQTVFKISVLSGPAIYITVQGADVDISLFTALLKGDSSRKPIPTILEYTYDDDYNAWFFNRDENLPAQSSGKPEK